MTMLGVVNKSTAIDNHDVMMMTRACAYQLRHHAAPIWNAHPIPVVYYASEKHAPSGTVVIAVLDNSDQADALGWHTEDSGDLEYGRVFAKPVLDNGGDALTAALSVASVLSHEVLEWFIDPHCNTWADDAKGTLYALEVGDPVESDSYTVPIRPRGSKSEVSITVSNFVTPHWFDPQADPTQKFDYMGRCKRPFEMTHGGYVVTRSGGQPQQKFGEHYPEWRKETKSSDLARTARRR